MRGGTARPALLVAVLGVLVGAATPPAAGAATTPSPAGSASPPGPTSSAAIPRLTGVTGAPSAGTATATSAVEDLVGAVEDLSFGEATADGAVQDLGGTEFRLEADVLFAFDKADLTPRARTAIADVATKLRAGGARSAAVTGFTDDKGSDSYNLALSQRRAAAVRAALAAALPGVTVTAAGQGEASPIADNATPQGQALNRRVEIRVG